MTCKHKFYADLDLSYLGYSPEVLIVGTFNPEWPSANYANWFYGRTDANYFWDVLPRILEGKSLLTAEASDWKEFCKRNKIAVTDLVKEITCFKPNNTEHKRLLATYSDDKLIEFNKYFKYNSIVEIQNMYPDIKKIYFTRKLTPPWKLVWKACGVLNIDSITELYTPSRFASYATSRWRKDNNYEKPMSIPDFIIGKWSEVLHFKSKVIIKL